MAEGRCPRCGATLPAGTACSRCLLALGLEPASDVSTAPMPESVGPFRVLDTLGEEDSEPRYLAEEAATGRRVVLRVVDRAADAEAALARFEAEEDRLAELDRPGLATRLDAGMSPDGRLWFATDQVPGVPLTELCDRERLPLDRRLELFAGVCDALGHAHACGVPHLNLHPGRLLARSRGEGPRVRVTDLGVARALEQRPTPELLFSRSGLLGGTLAYVSPEQLSPASPALGPRTDVYALGAVLYELLAGVPPFEVRRLRRAGWVEMCRIIQRENPERPSRRVAALDHIRSSEVARQRGTERRRLRRALEGDLDWITLKALEKDPKGRYPSARELGLDVRRARDGEPVAPGWGSAARRLLRLLRPS